jgi:type IV pilus assembly protein PilE
LFISREIFKKGGEMRRGFTLLELIVVIIIIGILATLAVGQYFKMVERGRTAEAKAILGQLRTSEIAYRMEHDNYTNDLSLLMVGGIGGCDPMHFFGYTVTIDAGNSFVATAERCVSNGKPPQIAAGGNYIITLNNDGNFGGTPGFY